MKKKRQRLKRVLKTYSTSKDWKKLFKENKTIFKDNLKTVKSSFSAFNANVDIITELDKSFPYKFDDTKSNCIMPTSIDSLKDLKNALVHSFVYGKASELKIENKELYQELRRKLNFKAKRIGGQMGIVANTLSYLGVQKVIVFTNLLSNDLAELFNDKVLFPSIKDDNLVFKKAIECGNPNDDTRVNIIIEYKQGSKIKLKDKTITIPRNNRFIISSPVYKSNPLLPKSLLRKELFQDLKRVFFSGYHHVKEKNVKKVFKEWVYQLKMIKQFNTELLIHVEYVDIHKKWLNNELFKVLKHVQSFGCNEVETTNLMKYLGEKKLYDTLIKSNHSPEHLVEAGNYLMKKFNFKRLSIHTLEYVMLFTEKNYSISNEKLLHANIYGVRVVNSKALAGEKFLNTLKTINEQPFSAVGVKAANKSYKTPYNLIIVPNMSEKKVPVIYTVGLGDTVSSAIFYAEEV
ncbi:MAG: hypothetical protein JW791_05200 [Nanoarchaeota archaeon]|nr:hypothetical protein [Nanoarchaeota archaeon]